MRPWILLSLVALACEEAPNDNTSPMMVPWQPGPGVDEAYARAQALAATSLEELYALEDAGVLQLGDPTDLTPGDQLPPPPNHCRRRPRQQIVARGGGQHVLQLSATSTSMITYSPQCQSYPCVTEAHIGAVQADSTTDLVRRAGGAPQLQATLMTTRTDPVWAVLLRHTSPADRWQLRACTCAGAGCNPASEMAVHFYP
jgi:hypothetical protein